MEAQIFIARILASVYLVLGVGILFNPTYYKKEVPKLFENNIFVIVFGGFLAIVFGGFIITFYNKWDTNLGMLISLVGWISLLKGFVLFLFPTQMSWYKKHVFTADNIHTVFLAILLVFGLLFSFFGFYY